MVSRERELKKTRLCGDFLLLFFPPTENHKSNNAGYDIHTTGLNEEIRGSAIKLDIAEPHNDCEFALFQQRFNWLESANHQQQLQFSTTLQNMLELVVAEIITPGCASVDNEAR